MNDILKRFFRDFMLDEMEWDPFRKIRNYTIGIIPEPVRKIVGWILLIFGAVALLRFYPGMLFYMMSDLMAMITLFVGISLIIVTPFPNSLKSTVVLS